MVDKYGLCWLEISKHLDLDPMKIKNRYYSHIKKRNLMPILLQESTASKKASSQVQQSTQFEYKVFSSQSPMRMSTAEQYSEEPFGMTSIPQVSLDEFLEDFGPKMDF
mmetsp:Transcript_36294/g.32577  ORF Transcript_36294/g.32577 Transcript_36294/m.32577 type:complete len:108 (-) Transcript_36294:205-528(-)